MKTIADALAIRRRVFGAFELAETASSPQERAQWLTFALVGGGPTGVELAGQIRELATQTLRDEFRTIRPEEARVLLFDGGDAPLKAFGPTLSGKAAGVLKGLGVELHMGARVTSWTRAACTSRRRARTSRYDARTVLWTAGVEAPALQPGSPRPPAPSTTEPGGSRCARTAPSRRILRSSSSVTS